MLLISWKGYFQYPLYEDDKGTGIGIDVGVLG